jgi:hypothetical protein
MLAMLGECDDGGRCPYPFPFSLTTMFAVAQPPRLPISGHTITAQIAALPVPDLNATALPRLILRTSAPLPLQTWHPLLKTSNISIRPSPPHTDSDTSRVARTMLCVMSIPAALGRHSMTQPFVRSSTPSRMTGTVLEIGNFNVEVRQLFFMSLRSY